jgi:Zn-dependent protease with chaperone function
VDFFARQEQTRRTSRVLVGAFLLSFLVCALATTFAISLVLRYASGYSIYNGPATWAQWVAANLGPLGWVMAVTLAIMVAASLFRAASLAGGGGDVARMMKATQVTGGGADPLQQRLVNVVEEMALASGVAVPEIFVLEHEAGINAFAAGTNHSNAAICVTRGALERLERAELQGVIAHEFSHILNGDMRLNQQLIGLSFGILALSLVGRAILRGLRFARPNRKDGSALAIALIAGIALLVIGWLGVFFSRLIKAAVSRQREALADASAVQFTREPQGLAGALKKIAAYGARILYAETEEVAHMLFERGSGALGGLFATHPPLIERIRALDPTFDPRDLPKPQPLPGPGAAVAAERAIAAARAEGGFEAAARTAAAVGAALSALPSADDPVRERAGQSATPEVGGALHGAVPDEIQQAARATDTSLLLILALAVAPDAPARDRQFALVENQLGHARGLDCRHLYDTANRVDRRSNAGPPSRSATCSTCSSGSSRSRTSRASSTTCCCTCSAPICARSRPAARLRRRGWRSRRRCAAPWGRCSRPWRHSATQTRPARAARTLRGSPRSAGPTPATRRLSSRRPRRAASRSSTRRSRRSPGCVRTTSSRCCAARSRRSARTARSS